MVVVPAATPVTTPDASTVATDVLLLVHAPPLTASERVIVAATQTLDEPEIVPAFGNGLTVTTWVAYAVPQEFVTV